MRSQSITDSERARLIGIESADIRFSPAAPDSMGQIRHYASGNDDKFLCDLEYMAMAANSNYSN